MRIVVTRDNICIKRGYEVRCRDMRGELERIKESRPNDVTENRSMYSLCCEWTVHNVLYRLGLFRSHTKDVDLNYPCKIEWLYILLGSFIYPFAR